MTTKLSKTSRRWVIPLYLIVGLLFFTIPADAQSRGETKGRSTKTEQKDKSKASRSRSGSSSASRSSGSSSSSRAGRSSSTRSGKASSSGRSSRSGQAAGQSSSSRSSGSSSTGRSRQPGQSAGTSSSSSRSSRTTANREGSSSRQSRSGTRSGSSRETSPSAGSSRAGSSRDRQITGRSGQNTRQDTRRGSTSTDTRRGSTSTDTRRGSTSTDTRRGSTSTDTRRGSTSTDTRRGSTSTDTRRGSTSTDTRSRDGSTATSSRQRSGDSRTRNNRTGSSTRESDRSSRSRVTTPSQGSTSTRRDDVRGRTSQDRSTVVSGRRDNTRVYIHPNRRQHSSRKQVYKRRNYTYPKRHRAVHVKPHLVVSPVYYHRPHVYINIEWPWQNRYYRNWNPHYRYKQVVYVNIGHGSQYRRSRVDVRTEYQQVVRYADHRKAVIDIYLDKIEVYEDGYYYGEVYRIPDHLSHIEATVYRNGDVVYDRDVFLVGDPQVGFEMISTQKYDGYVLDYYDRSHGYKVGKLDFRRKRVYSRRYSKLFDPYGYNGHAPISLLPEDRYLADYGYDSVSYNYYNDEYDPYYGGDYDDDYYDYYDDGSYYKYDAPRQNTYGRSPSSTQTPYSKQTVQARIAASGPIKLNNKQATTTRAGIAVNIEREAQLERIH